MPTAPPQPDLSLRVGIERNRDFDRLDVASAEAFDDSKDSAIRTYEELFQHVDQIVNDFAVASRDGARLSGARPCINVISALAKKGDQPGATAAVEPSDRSERARLLRFQGLMPFLADRYLVNLLGQAFNENFGACDSVCFDKIADGVVSPVRGDDCKNLCINANLLGKISIWS